MKPLNIESLSEGNADAAELIKFLWARGSAYLSFCDAMDGQANQTKIDRPFVFFTTLQASGLTGKKLIYAHRFWAGSRPIRTIGLILALANGDRAWRQETLNHLQNLIKSYTLASPPSLAKSSIKEFWDSVSYQIKPYASDIADLTKVKTSGDEAAAARKIHSRPLSRASHLLDTKQGVKMFGR